MVLFFFAVIPMSVPIDNVISLDCPVPELSEADYARQFETLLQPCLKSAYRLAYRFCGNADDAEDLVQDLLIKLFARRIDLSEIEQLQPWLAKSLYRLYVDTIRKHKRSPLSYVDEEDVTMQQGGDELTPFSQIQRGQLRAMISKGLARLSDEHRELIILCDMEGFSMPEVQQILEIPDGTIKSRLHRARAKLRDYIQIS